MTFGFFDDYPLWYGFRYDWNTWKEGRFVSEGRPLLSFVLDVCLSPVATVSGLKWPRLGGATGLALVALMLTRIEFRQSRIRFYTVARALIYTLVPAIAIYMAWTICFPYPVAACLSLLIGYAICVPPPSRWVRTGILPLGVAGLTAVGCVYQPLMGLALLPWALTQLRPESELDHGSTLRLFAVLLIAYAGYAVAYHFGSALLPEMGSSSRGSGSLDPTSNLAWFLDNPLPQAASGWVIVLNSGLPKFLQFVGVPLAILG